MFRRGVKSLTPVRIQTPDIRTVCILSRLSTSRAKLTISKCDVSSGGSFRIGTGLMNKVCTYFLFEETVFYIYLARWFVLRVNQEMLQIRKKHCDFQRTKHCSYVNKMPDCRCLVFAVCIECCNTWLASEGPLFSCIKLN